MRQNVSTRSNVYFSAALVSVAAAVSCVSSAWADDAPKSNEPVRAPSREIDLNPVGGGTSAPRPSAVISEGAVVTMMPGTLIWDAKGGLIFKPDLPTDGQIAPFSQPASLLPCAALARFESMLGVGVAESSTGQTVSTPPPSARSVTEAAANVDGSTRELGRYFINGQVFAFHGKPYILLSVPPSTSPASSPVSSPANGDVTPTPAAPQATTPTKPLTESADVQSLITDLESRRTTARALETAATLNQSSNQSKPDATSNAIDGSPAKDTASPTSARPDGQHVNGRQGRVVRHDAWLIFTPDSGSRSPSDVPLVLLPSAQMERLEGLVFRHGDSARYRISGKLITYKGRQFLLPTLAQVMPPSDLSPGH